MNIEKDFEDFIGLLNKHKVTYCIIGSFAVAFHAKPRYTKDMDILIEPTKDNSKKVLAVIHEFGMKSLKLSEDDFLNLNTIVQLGFEPIRIDLLTSLEGIEFSSILKNRKEGKYGTSKTYFIGLKELIKSKEIANRPQDKADVELLKKHSKKKI